MPVLPFLAPAPQDLIDLATAKQYLEIAPENTTDDDLLQSLITGASNYWLARTCRDSLNAVTDYDEFYDGTGGMRLPLRNWPVVSVASVSVSGAAVPGATNGTTAGWVIDQSKKGLALIGYTGGTYWNGLYSACSCVSDYERIATQDQDDFVRDLVTVKTGTYVYYGGSYGGGGFPLGVQNIQVQYTAGYDATPADIAAAVTKQVAINYKRRGWVDQKSIILPQGGGTATYRDWELPPDIEHVILLYTRTGDRQV